MSHASMHQFMNDLGKRHNELFNGDDQPVFTKAVTNDMSSNYYFSYNDKDAYVDQFDLQEMLSDDDQDNYDGYDNSSLDDKAYALNELARANYEELGN